MRTSPYNYNAKDYHYDKLSQLYKRELPLSYLDNLEKDELESMEETDTEKTLKKVKVGSFRKPNRHLIRDFSEFKKVTENKMNANDQMEKYRKQYELEKLRYAEERNKYRY